MVGYIDIIRWFWDTAPEKEGYKADYGVLFFALVDSINRNDWKETELEYGYIIYKTRIGKRMYLDGRRWLDENGFIAVKAGRGDYAKARFAVHSAVQSEVQKRTAKRTAKGGSAVQSEVQKCTAIDTASRTASDTAHCTYNTEDLLRPLRPKDGKTEDGSNSSEAATEKKIDGIELPQWAIKEKEEAAKIAAEILNRNPPQSSGKSPPLSWDNLKDTLMSEDLWVKWAQKELKYSLEELSALILDFVDYQQGIGETIKPDDVRKHLVSYGRKKIVNGKSIQNSNGNTHFKNGNANRSLKPSGFEPPATGRRFGSWDD